MTDRIKKQLDAAVSLHGSLMSEAESSFAHEIAAASFATHVDELKQILTAEKADSSFEIVEFRLRAPAFRQGAVPLRMISHATEDIRRMIGYAALRLVQGGIKRKRVPDDLYDLLNLRLAGVLPGSSRLVVAAAAHRDLFDDGIAKDALNRIFTVLFSNGSGDAFLESVTDLGPSSARRLRDFLKLVRRYSAEVDFTWRYNGTVVQNWIGSSEVIEKVSNALEVTELREQDEIILTGRVELLSKRERIHLRLESGELVRILYPKSLLDLVSTFHLDQKLTLFCQVTETENPLTLESSIFYELLGIQGEQDAAANP